MSNPASEWFGHRVYRSEEARLDAAIEDSTLRALGVIEDDEPTEYSHYAYMEQFREDATGEFTPDERMAIRSQLGLGPFGEGRS